MRHKYLLFLLWIKKEARSKNFLTDNAVDKTYCPLLPNFLSLISGTFPKPTALFIKSKIHNFLLLASKILASVSVIYKFICIMYQKTVEIYKNCAII